MNLGSLLGHADEFVRIVRKSPQPADVVLSDLLRARKYIGSSERRLLSELVFHTLRTLSWCEDILHRSESQANGRPPLQGLSHAALAIALRGLLPIPITDVLRKATGSDIDLDTLPTAADMLHGDEIPICTQPWLLEETERRWADAASVWRSMLMPAPLCLRVNERLADRERVVLRLQQDGIPCRAGEHSPVAIVIHERVNLLQHPLMLTGAIDVQDEGSQLIGIATQVQPGMRVLDACAGAGGKALHMADLMRDRGLIVARDIEGARLKETATRARRNGLQSIRLQVIDLRRPPKPEPFDVVLVDAPCSGTGTVRRLPMVKWRLTSDQARKHASKQLRILADNAANVAPGGLLVYATCSILPTENEDVVRAFLSTHPDFVLDAQSQSDPYHHGTDGLFWARMRKAE